MTNFIQIMKGIGGFISRNYMQLMIMTVLSTYLFISGDAETNKLIIGAFIGGFNTWSTFMTEKEHKADTKKKENAVVGDKDE